MPANLYKRCRCGKQSWAACPHQWDYRFEFQGNKYRGPTGTRNTRGAQRLYRQKRAATEAAPPKPPKGKGGITLMQAAAFEIMENEQRGLAGIHLHRLKARWRKVLSCAGKDTSVSVIDYDWLRQYEGMRRAQKIRGQTIVREIQAIRRGLKIAVRKGWIDTMPEAPRIRFDPPDPKRSGKFRDPELVRAYLKQMHQDARDEIVFVAMTGIRWAEVKRLRFEWLEPAPASFGVPALLRFPGEGTKSRKPREVGVPAIALAVVERRRADSRDGFVFTRSDYKSLRKRASKRLGLESTITLRDIRHTFASIAMQTSGDPTAVLRALGHKDLKMTERYLSAPLGRVARLGAAAQEAFALTDPDTKPDTEKDEIVTH